MAFPIQRSSNNTQIVRGPQGVPGRDANPLDLIAEIEDGQVPARIGGELVGVDIVTPEDLEAVGVVADGAIQRTELGAPGGPAGLDADGKIDESTVPESVVRGDDVDGTLPDGSVLPDKLRAPVPDDVGYDVILVVGQSNAAGGDPLGRVDVNMDPVDSRIWAWPGGGTYRGMLVQAKDPLAHHSQPLAVGPGMPVARAYAATIPMHRSVLLVPAAHGGTGFRTTDFTPLPAGWGAGGGSWDPDMSDGTNLYELAVAQTLAAVAGAPGANRIVGVVWVQGEADTTRLDGEEYADELEALIDGMRNRFDVPDLPFVIGQMLPEFWFGTPAREAINAAHVQMQARLEHVAFVYAPPAPRVVTDQLHYASADQRRWGIPLLRGLRLAAVNELGAPPVTPTAVVLKQTSTSTLTASWTRGLGRATDFLVEFNTGSGWSTFAHPATPDAVVTITGRAPGQTVQVRVSAINEDGTSAPSVAASLAMVDTPAQVTGLSSAAVAGGNQTLSWTAVAQALSYHVEYKAAASGTWLSGPTVTGTTAQVTGLSPLTSYDYRVAAINDAGTGPVSATLTNSTTALAALLTDMGVSAYHAFSLRKVRADYAGQCLRVRRSSDNVEQDIGFDGNGVLDTAAMLTFLGANSGFVRTWYDQSGNGRDVIQATAALQPRIVNAGTVETQASRPAVNFVGTTYLARVAASGLYAAAGASMLAVATVTGASNYMLAAESKAGSSNLSRWIPAWLSAAGINWTIAAEDPAGTVKTLIANTSAGTPTDGAYHQISAIDGGTAVSSYVDGTAKHNATPYSAIRSGVYNGDVFGVGGWATAANAATFIFNGKIAELVTFATALSDPQRTAGAANERSFYGTP